jgi:hypothetical protein
MIWLNEMIQLNEMIRLDEMISTSISSSSSAIGWFKSLPEWLYLFCK